MNKTKLYRIIRIAGCLAIITSVFYLYLPPVENIVDTMNKTVGEERVDVLCVGSSHMYSGLNPVQMYRDHGYAAYILACGSQAPWQSLYYIKETCSTQHPKIILLDVFMIGVHEEDDYEDYQTVNNMLYTPLSFSKIEVVTQSVANSRLDILLRFPYIHNDYEAFNGFTCEKFIGNRDYSMGFDYSDDIATEEQKDYGKYDVKNSTEEIKISEKNERYLRSIIEYCREKDIAVILINAPWPMINEKVHKRFNHIRRIAGEYDITFIDGDTLTYELGMDWTKDCKGNGGHLNNSGITKFTNYVENYIYSNYDIPDRRGNPDYGSYEEGVEWLDNTINNAL